MKRATYYTILGLNHKASKEEIKRSFRKLSLQYHPDRNPTNKQAHSIFIIISNAYQTLINEQARNEYDSYLRKFEHRVYAAPNYTKEYDPFIRNALSEYNYLLWDLEDLLRKITEEHLQLNVNGINLYVCILHLFKYLEEEILGEKDRYSNFSTKQDKGKLHLENYYYSLRIEIEKHIKNIDQKLDSNPNTIIKIMDVKNKLIKSIGEICQYI